MNQDQPIQPPYKQRKVLSLLQDSYNSKKELVEGVVGGLVLLGCRAGSYSDDIGNDILYQICLSRVKGWILMSNRFFKLVCKVIHNGNQRDIDSLKQAVYQESRNINYPCFGHSQLQFQIRTICKKLQILRVLNTLVGGSGNVKLFIDCEDAHYALRSGRFHKLAMITICDPQRGTVFLLRVQRLKETDLEDIRKVFWSLSTTRILVSFGPEFFLRLYKKDEDDDKIPCRDVQKKNNGQPQSLKDAAGELGIEVFKTEGISDWTVTNLTHDQKQYAAMDAYVLFQMDWLEQQSA